MEPIPGLDVNALMDVLHDRSEGPVDVRDAKIVSLSKKLRGMTVSMNRQNGNVAMLAEKLTKSQQEIKVMSEVAARVASKVPEKEVKEVSTPSSSSSKKVEALRLKLDASNEELKRYQKALSNEVCRK